MKTGNSARLLFCAVGVAMLLLFALPMGAQNTKPNIVVIFGDDIGYWNIGAYNGGSSAGAGAHLAVRLVDHLWIVLKDSLSELRWLKNGEFCVTACTVQRCWCRKGFLSGPAARPRRRGPGRSGKRNESVFCFLQKERTREKPRECVC